MKHAKPEASTLLLNCVHPPTLASSFLPQNDKNLTSKEARQHASELRTNKKRGGCPEQALLVQLLRRMRTCAQHPSMQAHGAHGGCHGGGDRHAPRGPRRLHATC